MVGSVTIVCTFASDFYIAVLMMLVKCYEVNRFVKIKMVLPPTNFGYQFPTT